MKKNKEINIQVYQIILKIKKFKVKSFKTLFLITEEITRIETAYSHPKLMMKDRIPFLVPSQIKEDLIILVKNNNYNQHKVNFSIKD